MNYGFGSRDYLRRAKARLSENTHEALFYAACELRCGVEARLHEYCARVNTSKAARKAWEINKLSKNVIRAFGERKTPIKVLVQDPDNGERFPVFYTPVSEALRKNAQRLGNYLHRIDPAKVEGELCWSQFRTLLQTTVRQLEEATSGIVLGPMIQGKDGKLNFKFEEGIDSRFDQLRNRLGTDLTMFITVKVLKINEKGVVVRQI